MDLVDVLVQVVALVEPLLTDGALVRLETLVDAHVGVQIVLLIEQPVTNVALVRFFTGVGPHVGLQVVRLDELLSAVGTIERFRRRMHQRMATEFFLVGEGPRAERTLEGILEDVCLHVGLEVVRLGERFLANLAFVRFDLIVLLHVVTHFLVVHEHLVAKGTYVGLLVCVANPNMVREFRRMVKWRLADLAGHRMSPHVGRQIVLLIETLLADGACVGTLVCVGPNVGLQIVRLTEVFTTDITFERLLARVDFHVSR